LEVYEQANFQVRGSEIVQALGHVFLCEPFYAFEFDYDGVLYADVCVVLAYWVAFVDYGK
jgi:hypothetical protein